jgi:hypothetical protein
MNGAHRGVPTVAGDLTTVCITKEDALATAVAIVDNAGATAWTSPSTAASAGTTCWETGEGTPALPVTLTEGAYSMRNAGATATDWVVIIATVEPS